MNFKKLKPILAAAVIILTVAVFSWYIRQNPAILTQLSQTDPWLVVGLLGLYAVFMVALVIIQQATLKLSNLQVPAKDNALLTIYSTIINFFGPLQSGPGFRGVYLKKKFGVSIKRYTFATLGYYACFAFWSGLFIATALSWQWWLGGLILGSLAASAAWKFSRDRIKAILEGWSIRNMVILLCATLFQLATVAVIYFVELRSLDNTISFHQALIYTGAANFALFVSLTPGAIGFRESFVLFTQHLHGVPTDIIVSASLLDRATYVILLVILFVVTLVIHAKDKLVTGVQPPTQTSDRQ